MDQADASDLRIDHSVTTLRERAVDPSRQVILTADGHDIACGIVQRLNSRISRLRGLMLANRERRVSGPAHMDCSYEAITASDAAAALEKVGRHLNDVAGLARACDALDRYRPAQAGGDGASETRVILVEGLPNAVAPPVAP